MLEEYFDPLQLKMEYEPFRIGACIDRFSKNFPDLEGKRMAIIGVPDGRKTDKNSQTEMAPDQIRKELYKLSCPNSMLKQLVDLGNLKKGNSFSDTEFALTEVVHYLLEKDLIPVVLGGGISLCKSIYKGFNGHTENLDLSFISAKLPLLEGEILYDILHLEPNYLFNINALGYQSYYVSPGAREFIQKQGYNESRLGVLKKNPEEAEPMIRNTSMFIMDIGAIKQADAPANYNSNPNGIDGDVACQLCWYAGVSDTVRMFGLFEMNPEFDYRNQTAKLLSQMLWYFIDGYNNRKNDHPDQHQEFIRYRCNIDNKHPDIVFHKSKRSGRWWMEIPHPKSLNNPNRNVVVPCTYSDYQQAAQGELPDRYLNVLVKIH